MLHLQLRVPADRVERVVDLLRSDETVTNVVVVPDAYVKPDGHLVLADVAREGANPVAALCLALARPRPSMIPAALRTLAVGFAAAVAVAAPLWLLGTVTGVVSPPQATAGELTAFIVEPDPWSFVVALLAGVAGMLSLTTSKSGPLVGVFISVTTVLAVGTFALCLGTGSWSDMTTAAVQLGVNLAGLLVAGTLTLLVQPLAWSKLQQPRKAHALADGGT